MDKNIITQVMTLFLIMAVGYVSRKRGILNPEINKGLTEIVINITLPFLIVSSFQFAFSREMLKEAGTVVAIAVVTHLLTILLAKLLCNRMLKSTTKVLQFCMVFSNFGVVGYPIIGSVFGQRGIFFTSIYLAISTVFCWTYGVLIFTGKADRHSLVTAFKNPGIVALFLGIPLFLFSVKLPLMLTQTLQMVGFINTPLSMLLIGSILADVKPKEFFSSRPLYYGTLIRLLLIPMMALFCLKWFNFPRVILGVCVLIQAMPAPATAIPFAEHYNGNVLFATQIVFLTTIFSIFTIPLIIGLL
jgi:malate permease and related proteins